MLVIDKTMFHNAVWAQAEFSWQERIIQIFFEKQLQCHILLHECPDGIWHFWDLRSYELLMWTHMINGQYVTALYETPRL